MFTLSARARWRAQVRTLLETSVNAPFFQVPSPEFRIQAQARSRPDTTFLYIWHTGTKENASCAIFKFIQVTSRRDFNCKVEMELSFYFQIVLEAC